MYCVNCGAQNAESSKYCVSCGKKLTYNKPEIIRLRCRDCNGIMDIDDEQQIISCPYCGSKALILESDDVKIERIRAKTEEYKQDRQSEISKQRMDYIRESEESKKRKILQGSSDRVNSVNS